MNSSMGSEGKNPGQVLYEQLALEIANAATELTSDGDFHARLDGLETTHTWKFLFDFAFTQFSNEGSEFVKLCINVIRSHANRLGYVFNSEDSFLEALSTHLWHTIGFEAAPEDTAVSSLSGKLMYNAAIQALRSHVQDAVYIARTKTIGVELMAYLTHLRNGLMFVGLLLLVLMVWSVSTFACGLVISRRREAAEQRTLETEEYEARADRRMDRAVASAVARYTASGSGSARGSDMQMRPLMPRH